MESTPTLTINSLPYELGGISNEHNSSPPIPKVPSETSSNSEAVPPSSQLQHTSTAIATTTARATNESTPTLSINSLPYELLLRVLLLLPLRTRGLVEGVCKKWREALLSNHWRDVHHYDDRGEQRAGDTNNYPLFSRRRQQLLHLIGPHLKSATLSMGKDQAVRDALGQCLNLVHLQLGRDEDSMYSLRVKTLKLIRRDLAPRLKTLSLVYCISHRDSNKGIKAKEAFYKLLRELPSLEYIRLKGSNMPRGFVLPIEMSGLLKLTLHDYVYKRFINVNLSSVTPYLRSLTLDTLITAMHSIADFPQLRHLRLKLFKSNIRSFIDNVLPKVEKLRALEVISPIYYSLKGSTKVQRLFAALGLYIPQLEHLGFATNKDDRKFKLPEAALSAALGRKKGLTSLELKLKCLDAAELCKWDWLEGMSGLQHLALTWEPSLSTLCTIVEKCRELRYMDLGGFVPDADACAALAAAAATAAGAVGNCQTVKEENAEKPPMLSLRVDKVRGLDGIDTPLPLSGKDFGCARLRFVREKMYSPVLYRHAYGFLTEGKPKWEEEHSLME